MIDQDIYWIKSIHSGKCLDICQDHNSKRGKAILYDYYRGKNQQFLFKKVEGFFIIHSMQSGKVLELENGHFSNGAVIREAEYNGSSNQKWRLVETAPHSQQYLITSALGNKVMDVCNQKKSNGAQIFLYDAKHSQNQIWQLILADDGDYPLKCMGGYQSDYPKEDR